MILGTSIKRHMMFSASVDKIVYQVFLKNFLFWKAKSVKIFCI